MTPKELPLPPHYIPQKVGEVWQVPYQQRAVDARRWAVHHAVPPASGDRLRVTLLLVDVQNTFCMPGFELFVAGRSGTGAVDDSRRLCEFIYRNLNRITRVCPTMDTHQAMQIFHSLFFVDPAGEPPAPFTLITEEDVARGHWQPNPEVARALGFDPRRARDFLRHYTRELKRNGKYELTVWPYHAMLGGIGHALVAAVEEAIFFHSVARFSAASFQIKGDHPLTENYSVIRPEVMDQPGGERIADKNTALINMLLECDALLVAGQAKSHCVAWTVGDLLEEIVARDKAMSGRVYLLEDCMSPVVIPGAVDYTEAADEAFQRFAAAGMHIVRTTEALTGWPGIFAAER